MINSFVLAGKIQGDVLRIELKSGKTMVAFEFVAEYDKGGGYAGRSEHRCKAFGNTAQQILESGVSDGARLVLQGSIETDSYEGKNGPAKSNNFVVMGFERMDDAGDSFI
jgi:single-stranded DNA-binding protein